HWFLNRAMPTCDSQSQVTSWTGTLTNIDRQKQLEERSQLIIHAVNGLVFDWDLVNNSLYRSEQLHQLVGVHPDAALPTVDWWRDRIHPEDMARLQPQLEAMFNNASGLYESEYRVRHADGRWIDVRERSWLVRDNLGHIVRIVGSTVDISDRKRVEAERKRFEAALADNESRLQSFVNANVVGILYGDAHGYIYKANDELLKIIGYSREELAARRIHWANITPPEYLPIDENGIAESRQKGACTPYEKEYIRKDGSRVPVLIGYSQVGETKEETIAFVLDLSALKTVEAQREQLLRREQIAREEAERANRVKDEFLTVLSHELRTPLNPILGWANLLQTRQLGQAKTALALSTIERNAKLQAQLVDDLLDVAKILQGKLTLETAPVDLNTVIAAAIDTVKPAATAKSIALRFAPSGADDKSGDRALPDHPNLTSQVMGDQARLQQIVWNLLSNATKFTPDGGQVDVQLDHSDRQVKIIVKDTGQGIKPEFLPLLFESFRQEDISITRQHGGLGLGLSIVRYLVEAHGGTIAAASPGEGLGATFTVSLPALKPQFAAHPAGEPTTPAPNLSDIRVLLVDDHLDTLELLATLLTQYGAIVLAVNSAVEAMETLEIFHPDLLVSDIGMPGADGHTLIQGIRALPPEKGGQVPALAFTSYCQDDDYQQTITSGYQRLIAKPLEVEQLINAIAGLAHSAKSTSDSFWP
ncbi:MAG: ATP-binding protein, partial [Nodosilinea sp.]